MSGFKGIMKDGWHPKGREGRKESWRNDFKGVNQVAGWMGKGKDPKDEDRENHVSRPLSSLKDPASFGPPPKHIRYHGAAALPNETTPDRSGLGAPLSREQINNSYTRKQQEEEEERRKAEEAAKRPPVPYRANRTGIDPSTLPPPPVRRTGSVAESAPASASPRPVPSVPPRVPPRTSTITPASHTPTPPAYTPNLEGAEQSQAADGYLNQAAVSRLAQAGVSVPALGISARPSNPTSPAPSYNQAPVNELQSRFSQMRTNSASSPSPAPSPPVQQTQSPVNSASNFSDARSAFNDFRSKHSDQIESGKQKLNGFNQKYGISERINNALDSKSGNTGQAPPIPPHPNLSRSTTMSSSDTASLAQRKAPPPPPPQKKAELRSAPVNTGSPAPPPLPLGTKPR
ncbi:uncharacterized protein BDW70DRAFT_155138 [Aspergillus foveolatus]|uniref:uncharacterized protein n=1 Tax=Aspergillus foveolatus TaxID=210207 RepID=UPI003CCD1BBB